MKIVNETKESLPCSNANAHTKATSIPVKTLKFISIEEFQKIIKYIRNSTASQEDKLCDECAVRVMFEAGLRLGEFLGSTLEDYVIKKIGDGNQEREICCVYIRNRFTDKKFQKAKMCMKIKSRAQYDKNEYSVENMGYQLSFLSMDTYDLICEYINIAHGRAYKLKRTNYEMSKADSVDEYRVKNKDNYYLVVNSKGTPMSQLTWNARLKSIYEAVGLDIDDGARKYNLSTKLRQGFIRYLVYNMKMPEERVMALSRRKSLMGFDGYINTTTEQIIRTKSEIEDETINLWIG